MSDNTKMREAFVQACKEYGPTISFGDFECGWDACMAWQAAQSAAVPVVGNVIYIRKDKLQRVQQFRPSLCEIYTTPAKAGLVPLIIQPTTSITADELDALRKGERDREVGSAIQRAAKELPEGCDISIRIENGSASVELYLPDTDASFDMDVDGDNRLAAEIHAAIDAAIAGEK